MLGHRSFRGIAVDSQGVAEVGSHPWTPITPDRVFTDTASGRAGSNRPGWTERGLAATKPMKLDAAQQKRLLRLYQQGEPVSELTSMFGISRSTLFRTLKVLKQQEPVSA